MLEINLTPAAVRAEFVGHCWWVNSDLSALWMNPDPSAVVNEVWPSCISAEPGYVKFPSTALLSRKWVRGIFSGLVTKIGMTHSGTSHWQPPGVSHLPTPHLAWLPASRCVRLSHLLMPHLALSSSFLYLLPNLRRGVEQLGKRFCLYRLCDLLVLTKYYTVCVCAVSYTHLRAHETA